MHRLTALFLAIALLLLNSVLILFIYYTFPSIAIFRIDLATTNQSILWYLISGNQTPLLTSALTVQELSHLTDVKNIIRWLPYLGLGMLGIALVLRAQHQLTIPQLVKSTARLLVQLVVLVMFFFFPLFTGLHYLLFPQGNWEFPASSVLIQLYPLDYWRNTMFAILVLSCLEVGLVYLTSKHYYINDKKMPI